MKNEFFSFLKNRVKSTGLEPLAVAFVLAFSFQIVRLIVGHEDNNAIKISKMAVALIFLIWTRIHLKNKKVYDRQ